MKKNSIENQNSLDEYQKYLNEQLTQGKAFYDKKLEDSKRYFDEAKRKLFEDGLKEITKTTEKMKTDAVARYNQSIENIKDAKYDPLKDRMKKSAENALKMSLDIANSIIDNYIKDFQ